MRDDKLRLLQDLLVEFKEEMTAKYSWYSTDEINWLVEEIDDQLGVTDSDEEGEIVT